MKTLQVHKKQSLPLEIYERRCKHCGHDTTAGRCTNLRCPGINWSTRRQGLNAVELRPVLQRSLANEGFLGTLYVKEVRMVDDCECQGVSVSTIASGLEKNKVVEQIVSATKERAQHYVVRGYKVKTTKLVAA